MVALVLLSLANIVLNRSRWLSSFAFGLIAVTALLGGDQGHDEHLHTWLEHGDATLRAFDEGRHPVAVAAAEEGFGVVDQLSMVNVALQAQTLAAHPLVRARHRAGDLEVIGLFYDIGTAAALLGDRPQIGRDRVAGGSASGADGGAARHAAGPARLRRARGLAVQGF